MIDITLRQPRYFHWRQNFRNGVKVMVSSQGLGLIKIEGMAMSGHISNAEIVECSDGRAKIVARDRDGNIIETECMEKDAAKRNFAVIKLYLKWSKHINKS